jgi:hypothetical protein
MRGKKHPLTTKRQSQNQSLPSLTAPRVAKINPEGFVKTYMTDQDKKITAANGSSSPGEVVFKGPNGQEFIVADYDCSDPGSLGESLRTLLMHYNEIKELNAQQLQELFCAWHKGRCNSHEVYKIHANKAYAQLVKAGKVDAGSYEDGDGGDMPTSEYDWACDWTYEVRLQDDAWQIDKAEYCGNFVIDASGVSHDPNSGVEEDEFNEMFTEDLPHFGDHWVDNVVGKHPKGYKL